MFLTQKFVIYYFRGGFRSRPGVRKDRIANDFGIDIEDRCALKAVTEVRS
jgi:hypothetical protein